VTRPPDEENTQPASGTRAGRGDPPAAAGRGSGRLGLALFLVSAAQFVLQLDFSIVNVALATIQREFGVSAADLQWVVTGYALPFGALLLLGGRLGDLLGHRRLLTSGLVAFGVTSLGAGLAPDAGALIAFRFLQGASAALVAPMALAAVTDLFDDGPARNRALGIFQGATAGGATAGIVLGGILTQYAGWRSIFLVNPPVIAILVAVMLRLLPRDRHGPAAPEPHDDNSKKPRLDLGGAALVTASVAALIYGLTQGQQRGFESAAALGSLALAVLLAAAFVVVERTVAAPMVPFAVLADPGRRAALLVQLLLSAVVGGYVYFIALYMQRALGFSALEAGLGLLPATVTIVVMSTFVTRRLIARLGLRAVLVIGLVSVALGQLWLSRMTASGSYAADVLPGIMLSAWGMSLVFPATSIAATARMRPGERGLAGGLFAMSQQVGLAVGLAVLATVAAARTRAVSPASGLGSAAAQAGWLVSGYRLAYLAAAIVAASALAVALALLRGKRAP
jgi:EmrB/QacA subfamily drug resistance transporter